jgi:hypothetical protein
MRLLVGGEEDAWPVRLGRRGVWGGGLWLGLRSGLVDAWDEGKGQEWEGEGD